MGSYVPTGRKKRNSISQALAEAERDHLLDCPNADYFLRAEALVLDAILLYLMWKGIHHGCTLIGTQLIPWVHATLGIQGEFLSSPETLMAHVALLLQIGVLFAHLVWSTSCYGGSPGKLLLGLRVIDIADGRLLDLGRCTLREIVGKSISFGAFGFGALLPLVREDHRALHDLMSQSVVKRVHGKP